MRVAVTGEMRSRVEELLGPGNFRLLTASPTASNGGRNGGNRGNRRSRGRP